MNICIVRIIRVCILISGLLSMSLFANPKISGELKKWHSVAITFTGPHASENGKINPFTDYRLNALFTHKKTGKQYKVPGFFAADGNAAQTGATEGNQWRVIFTPDEIGQWDWQISFRTGPYAAISDNLLTGKIVTKLDGKQGHFTITQSDKTYPDFRQRGRLMYVNKPYLKFAEQGGYFIKAGPDAPENLLSYADFDGSFHNDGHKDHLVKTWHPHVKDWQTNDPTWQNGKGKGLIGAINYLSEKGMNSISFLTLNIKGDDQNVFPFVDYNTYDRYDVSKLAQWNIVFSHAQKKGLFLHFKTQEVENQGLLDNGGLGLQRQVYYRELIARFGHHLALNWNMGEENGEWYANHQTPPQNTQQRLAMAKYFYLNDPYHHHIVIHNGNFFEDISSPDSYYTGVSLQTGRADFGSVHDQVKRLRGWPVINDRPFAVSVDEPGDAQYSLQPDEFDAQHNDARTNGLWGALTAGAWGTEWYFGYKRPHSDLTAEDFRSRDNFWTQAKYALDFFKLIDVDYQNAVSQDEALNHGWALAKDGEFYIMLAKNAQKDLKIRMRGFKGQYNIYWYNPRNGGDLQTGSIKSFIADTKETGYWQPNFYDLGKPPADINKDWVIFVKRATN